jgi:carbonic anhydrase
VKTFETGQSSEFQAAQFHIHAPSEHTVDGYHYDLEVHLVHTYSDGKSGNGVIGIFFDRKMGGTGRNAFVE